MNDLVKITYSDSSFSECCFFTEEKFKQFDINDEKKFFTLTIASITVNINIVVADNNAIKSNELRFSSDLKNIILIPENTVLQIKKTGEDHLEIGPIVGIFINPNTVSYLSRGKTNIKYEQFNTISKNLNGLFCIFSISDIDWDSKLVNALIFNKSKWTRCKLPLPKVIYDRAIGPNCRAAGIKLRKSLDKEYVVVNSIPKLGKWETIQALSKNPELVSFIPETIIYNGHSDLNKMLNKYSSIYFKPDILSKGKGVCRISKGTAGNFIVEYRTVDKNHKLIISSLKQLDKLVSKFSRVGKGYIIQREIEKASFRGIPFDFRLLYQKNYQGKWQPTGIAVRMGAPGSVITSPRSGGKVEEFSTILKELYNEDISEKNGLYSSVVDIGKKVVQTIDREFGDCVELGLDMTIDVNRNIWIIEVNGKPLKVSLKWLSNPEILNRCYNLPIEYAVYKTGFESADTESMSIKK